MEFRILNTIFILIISLYFTSCQKEIKLDLPEYEPRFVVDGKIETGLPPFILLTTTKNIFAPADLDTLFGSYIDDAIVEISDGSVTDTLQQICTDEIPKELEEAASIFFGIPKELMSKYHLCAYSTLNPLFIGTPGKTYSIKINYQGKTYRSSTKIESPVTFDSLYWKPENSIKDYGLIYADIKDPASQQNNYYWEVLRLKNDKYGNNVDMKFYKTRNPTFDDQFFNGLPFSFFYENPRSRFDETIPEEYRGYYQRGDTVLVKFSTIGRNEYIYYRKKHSQLNSAGSPFASPINIPSNISNNALGIWAGFSTTYQLLICR